MIYDRKVAFDKVCRGFAITRYEIEGHQEIADYSLNIHGENFFRDILNFIYGLNLENTNFKTTNAACIDLHDSDKKLGIQITTTRSKDKIINTLNVFKNPDYQNHDIKIYFLLDKSTPTQATVDEIQNTYSVDLKSILFDYTDLIKVINDLPEVRLIELAKKYFSDVNERYTDEVALNLIINHLITTKNLIQINYDDNFGTIPVDQKLELNNINPRISAEISSGLDYRHLVDRLSSKDNTLTELRSLVIDEIYTGILCNNVLNLEHVEVDKRSDTLFLHSRAISLNLDFNKIIFNLHSELLTRVEINDFNSSGISWILISYFFELCDIGAHKK
jgi:hypothetical protein